MKDIVVFIVLWFLFVRYFSHNTVTNNDAFWQLGDFIFFNENNIVDSFIINFNINTAVSCKSVMK